MSKAYLKRNEILKGLGYASYADYLKSKLWFAIRSIILKKENYKCCVCGDKATQVHHRSYTKGNLSGRAIFAGHTESMRAVCQDCHYHAEFQNGKKTNLGDANKLIPHARKCGNPDCRNVRGKKKVFCKTCSRSGISKKRISHNQNPKDINHAHKQIKNQGCKFCGRLIKEDKDYCVYCYNSGKVNDGWAPFSKELTKLSISKLNKG